MSVTAELASSTVRYLDHSLELVPAEALAQVGLSAERVRAMTMQPRKARDRKRRTRRAALYGWHKVTVANLPADGIVVASVRQADTLRIVARRMGIDICVRRIGAGPARLILPALSGAELSLISSGL